MFNPSARARRIPSVLVLILPMMTLLACFVIAHVCKMWKGGLMWPFFSDIGRDKPAYYVFVAGLSCAALAGIFSFYFNGVYQLVIVDKLNATGSVRVKKFVKVLIHFARVLGMLSTIGLPVLSVFDAAHHPIFHKIGAYWFFSLELITCIMIVIISNQFFKMSKRAVTAANIRTPPPESDLESPPSSGGTSYSSAIFFNRKDIKRFKKIFIIQVLFLVTFTFGFLCYIPLSGFITGPAPRLSIEDCIKKNLGVKYCQEEMRFDEKDTILTVLEGWGWQFRALCQLTAILSLLGFSSTFILNDHETAVQAKEEARATVVYK